MRRNQSTDFLDEMFRELENDELGQSINEFAENVRRQVDDSLHKNGYYTRSEYMNRKDVFEADVNEPKKHSEVPGLKRYNYFMSLLDEGDHEQSGRGYYAQGHAKAVDIYRSKSEFCQSDLVSLEDEVAKEIHRAKLNRKQRDRFEAGYLAGLQCVEKALERSKLYMMTIIKEEMEEI